MAKVFKALPQSIEKITKIETLVVDDGSSDKTSSIAKKAGATKIIRQEKNQGLAKTFNTALETSLKMGADIIVNIDGDNQYCPQNIPDLIRPILDNKADIVIGTRPIKDIQEFSWLKKKLQYLGSFFISNLAKTSIIDAASGFRAYSQEAALHLNVTTNYTYTLETIIQAGRYGLRIANTPISINEIRNKSHLYKNIGEYLYKNAISIINLFLRFEPLKIFIPLSSFFLLAGAGFCCRYVFFLTKAHIHIQSLIEMGFLFTTAIVTIALGLILNVQANNNRTSEELLYLTKKRKVQNTYPNPPQHTKF